MPSRNRAREAAKAAAENSASDPKTAGKRSAGKGKAKSRKVRGKKGGKRAGKRPTGASHDSPGRAAAQSPKRPRTGPGLDPSAADDAETRFVQPHEATKTYICPGCNRDIPPGLGHLVAVPPDEPDLRRHWHRGCWHNRHTRF